MEEFKYRRWKYWEPCYVPNAAPVQEIPADLFSKCVRAYISQEETRGISLDKLILSGRIYLAKKDLGEEVPSLSSDEMAFINAMDEFRGYDDIVRPDIRLVVDLIKFYCCAFADMPEATEILQPLENVANWSNFDYEWMPVAAEGDLYLQIGNAAVKACLSDESTRCILQYFFDDHATGGNDALREQISLDCRKMRQYLPRIFVSKKIESLLSQNNEELILLRALRRRLFDTRKVEAAHLEDDRLLQYLDERIKKIEEALRPRTCYPFKGCAEAKAYLCSEDLDLRDFPEGIRLKTAALNRLTRAGIHTVRQLLEFSRDDLLNIRGFGKGRLEEVIGFLYSIGYSPGEMGHLSL